MGAIDTQIRRLKKICASIPCNQNCMNVGFCAEVYEIERSARNDEQADSVSVNRPNSHGNGDAVPVSGLGD